MRTGSFEFSRRELAGAMGDFGTLFPLAIGFIVVNGLDPASFLVMMGLTNIALGLIYRLPMPLQPKKAVAAAAISQKWSPGMVYASGFGLGILWLVLAFTGFIERLASMTPKSVVRGIQLALGVMLAQLGYQMLRPDWGWGLVAIITVLLLRTSRRVPAALVLMGLGAGAVGYQGELVQNLHLGLGLPRVTMPSFGDIQRTMLLAGLAQVPLTLTNACIATCSLIEDYFPDRRVTERQLLVNMGGMNVVGSFFGAMPMCHGAGGLAGQYYYGARTGGANIMEGLIEAGLGLFVAGSIAGILTAFPGGIIGGMMVLVGIELARFTFDVERRDVVFMVLTAGLSVLANMGVGFVVGVVAWHLWHRIGGRDSAVGL
jgi:hypothetical protein